MSATTQTELIERYRPVWHSLGFEPSLVASRGLPLFEEGTALVTAGVAANGREYRLVPEATCAWARMQAKAADDRIEIRIVSAYRSVARQAELISGKLEAGQSLNQVLSVLAPPGCSEHHTGRAVDIAAGDTLPLEPEFEDTPAFAWLMEHAGGYGFTLSFPRNNPYGYVYEPWHWCFSEGATG